MVQRRAPCFGKVDDDQQGDRTRAVAVLEDRGKGSEQVVILPDEGPARELDHEIVHVRLGGS
jgi:hypothetical protein